MKAYKKLNLILSGVKNYIFENPEIESQAKKRGFICASCPSLKVIANVPQCGNCGCLIELAIRSPKKECPLKKW